MWYNNAAFFYKERVMSGRKAVLFALAFVAAVAAAGVWWFTKKPVVPGEGSVSLAERAAAPLRSRMPEPGLPPWKYSSKEDVVAWLVAAAPQRRLMEWAATDVPAKGLVKIEEAGDRCQVRFTFEFFRNGAPDTNLACTFSIIDVNPGSLAGGIALNESGPPMRCTETLQRDLAAGEVGSSSWMRRGDTRSTELRQVAFDVHEATRQSYVMGVSRWRDACVGAAIPAVPDGGAVPALRKASSEFHVIDSSDAVDEPVLSDFTTNRCVAKFSFERKTTIREQNVNGQTEVTTPTVEYSVCETDAAGGRDVAVGEGLNVKDVLPLGSRNRDFQPSLIVSAPTRCIRWYKGAKATYSAYGYSDRVQVPVTSHATAVTAATSFLEWMYSCSPVAQSADPLDYCNTVRSECFGTRQGANGQQWACEHLLVDERLRQCADPITRSYARLVTEPPADRIAVKEAVEQILGASTLDSEDLVEKVAKTNVSVCRLLISGEQRANCAVSLEAAQIGFFLQGRTVLLVPRRGVPDAIRCERQGVGSLKLETRTNESASQLIQGLQSLQHACGQ